MKRIGSGYAVPIVNKSYSLTYWKNSLQSPCDVEINDFSLDKGVTSKKNLAIGD